MKRNVLLLIAMIFPLFVNGQIDRVDYRRYANATSYIKRLYYKAEETAYNMAMKEDIFTYDALKNYLDDKNETVDDYKRTEFGRMFKQVVSKGKDFPKENRFRWRQFYYNYLFNKTYDELDKKTRINDSIARNRWFDSDIYLGLKLYCMQDVPPMDKECSEMIEKYGVDKLKAYNHFVKEAQPINPTDFVRASIGKKDPTDEDLASIKGLDVIGLQSFLNKALIHTRDLEFLYRLVLKEMGYNTSHDAMIPDYIDNYLQNKFDFVFSQEKNKPKLKELDSLFHKWKEIVKSRIWDYYQLSESRGFKKACANIKEALEYRKNHPLADGVYNVGNEQVPCKVFDDKLVVDGICILTEVDDQYPHATGDWYKKRTSNLKMVVKVENGVAVSKKFSGTQKVWMPDENVFKRTQGSFIQKTAKTLAAKPVVVKTINVADVAHYFDFKIIQDRILDRLVFYRDPDASLSHLCKCYLEGDSEYGNDDWYLERIKLPIQSVDISKVIE